MWISENPSNFKASYTVSRIQALSHSVANVYIGLAIATVTILVRCCFRVAELHDGYGGKLANDEVSYMVRGSVTYLLLAMNGPFKSVHVLDVVSRYRG